MSAASCTTAAGTDGFPRRYSSLNACGGHSPVGHGDTHDNAEIDTVLGKNGVSVPQLCIHYVPPLGLAVLLKTKNPGHMCGNAEADFEISDADLETLRNAERIKDCGDASVFPVHNGKMDGDVTALAWLNDRRETCRLAK